MGEGLVMYDIAIYIYIYVQLGFVHVRELARSIPSCSIYLGDSVCYTGLAIYSVLHAQVFHLCRLYFDSSSRVH